MTTMTYFKLNPKARGYKALIARLEKEFAEATGGGTLTVDENVAGDQAWVKAPSDSDIPDAILLDSATAGDLDRVRADINTETWAGKSIEQIPRLGVQPP